MKNIDSLGVILSTLRKNANLTQTKVAEKMEVPLTTISRLESDSIKMSKEEFVKYLDSLSTGEANEAKDYYLEDWQNVKRVDYFHPNRREIQRIEKVLRQINVLLTEVAIDSPFISQLRLFKKNLIEINDYLADLQHRIAFIGPIGVGKTHGICKILDLIMDDNPILEVGSGRTTVCEVMVKAGKEPSLSIIPLSETEIYNYINDFTDNIWITAGKEQDDSSSEIPDNILPREIARCLRNMTELPPKTRSTPMDQAVELAQKFTDKEEFRNSILLRINIHNRIKTEIKYAPSDLSELLPLIKEDFKNINHGKNPGFSIPSRIIITIPFDESLFFSEKFDIEFLDTKGIDESANRADLIRHLNDNRSLIVLCSRFNDAPGESIRSFVEKAIEIGSKDKIVLDSIFLTLHQNNEALQVIDLEGNKPENKLDGYDIKKSDIENVLQQKYKMDGANVSFFDAIADDAKQFRKELIERLSAIRAKYSNRVYEISSLVEAIEKNHENEVVQKAYAKVNESFKSFLEENSSITVKEEFLDAIVQNLTNSIKDRKMHAGTVRASVNRNGEYDNLDYYNELGLGSRIATVKTVTPLMEIIKRKVDWLLSQSELASTHKFLPEIIKFTESEFSDIYKNIQSLGRNIYWGTLYSSTLQWNELKSEWGKGTGYKDRVTDRTENWLKDIKVLDIRKQIKDNIELQWKSYLHKLNNLLKMVS